MAVVDTQSYSLVLEKGKPGPAPTEGQGQLELSPGPRDHRTLEDPSLGLGFTQSLFRVVS